MNHRLVFPALTGLLIATVLLSLSLGRYPVSPKAIGCFLAQKVHILHSMGLREFETLDTVLIHIRLPRIISAM